MSQGNSTFGLVKRPGLGSRNGVRYFGTIGFVSDGGFVVDRDDDGGRVHIDARDASRAGVTLQASDRVEFSIRPGGEGFDVMLCAYSGERHRQGDGFGRACR